MSALTALPCPFCGLDDTYLVRPDRISETALVGCNACGAIGPVTYQQSVAEAIERWNTRPNDHFVGAAEKVAGECTLFLNL